MFRMGNFVMHGLLLFEYGRCESKITKIRVTHTYSVICIHFMKTNYLKKSNPHELFYSRY